MNTDDDARRKLEQHALRNVRGLVEKIEADDKASGRTQNKLVIGMIVAVLAAIGAGIYFTRPKEPAAPIVVQPQKAPAQQPATPPK